MAQENTGDAAGQDMPTQNDQPNDRGQNRQEQQGGDSSERIDTDGDGRTREPDDARPSDQGGNAPAVER